MRPVAVGSCSLCSSCDTPRKHTPRNGSGGDTQSSSDCIGIRDDTSRSSIRQHKAGRQCTPQHRWRPLSRQQATTVPQATVPALSAGTDVILPRRERITADTVKLRWMLIPAGWLLLTNVDNVMCNRALRAETTTHPTTTTSPHAMHCWRK